MFFQFSRRQVKKIAFQSIFQIILIKLKVFAVMIDYIEQKDSITQRLLFFALFEAFEKYNYQLNRIFYADETVEKLVTVLCAMCATGDYSLYTPIVHLWKGKNEQQKVVSENR